MANGRSDSTVLTVANSIGNSPFSRISSAAGGFTQASVVVSPASTSGVWPTGVRATKNSVSKRLGKPTGVTQRLQGCRPLVIKRVPDAATNAASDSPACSLARSASKPPSAGAWWSGAPSHKPHSSKHSRSAATAKASAWSPTSVTAPTRRASACADSSHSDG